VLGVFGGVWATAFFLSLGVVVIVLFSLFNF